MIQFPIWYPWCNESSKKVMKVGENQKREDLRAFLLLTEGSFYRSRFLRSSFIIFTWFAHLLRLLCFSKRVCHHFSSFLFFLHRRFTNKNETPSFNQIFCRKIFRPRNWLEIYQISLVTMLFPATFHKRTNGKKRAKPKKEKRKKIMMMKMKKKEKLARLRISSRGKEFPWIVSESHTNALTDVFFSDFPFPMQIFKSIKFVTFETALKENPKMCIELLAQRLYK